VIEMAPAVLGRSLRAPRKILLESLDPEHFVSIRRIPGGPAPEAVQAAIRQADTQATADALWLREKSALLTEYPARIREACQALVTAPANR
jgi:argininosuccinate lyase